MRRLLLTCTVLAVAITVVAGPADAKRKPTCQKLIKAYKAKVAAKSNGVFVYQQRNLVGICDKRQRKLKDVAIVDEGQKVSAVKAVAKRCALIQVGKKDAHPTLYFKDFKLDEVVTAQPGYGSEAPAGIGSIALASNCGAAWGQYEDGAYTIRAFAITPASDLGRAFTTVATVAGPADIAKVTAKAAGRKVTVGWTAAGAPQTATLPAG